MKKEVRRTTERNLWKTIFAVALLATWVSIPLFTGSVKADSTPVIIVRSAALTSPAGNADPHGAATWQLYQSGNRELEIEIEDVNQIVGTILDGVVDGNIVGQLTVDIARKGRLKLRTSDGQTVPVVNDGSTVAVKNGSTVLVNGFFMSVGPTPTPSASPTASPSGSPTTTPSPSPTGTPNAGDLFAGLTGSTINGVLPRGFAQFEHHSSRVELEVTVREVNVPAGTSLNVVVDGLTVGSIAISKGEGRLRLRSDNGQTVPVVVAGSKIGIQNSGVNILAGTFAGFAGPSPTPSASPTPSLGRSFESHLVGGNIVPPVTTLATGEVKVTLSADESQATVFGEFHRLSSAQTGARIETTVGTTTIIRDLGVVGGTEGHFAQATFAVSAAQVQQLRAGLWSAIISSTNNPAGEIAGALTQHSSDSDFDGDGSHDFAVFRPSSGTWYSQNSIGFSAQAFGTLSDVIVSGDYDGDGKTDAAVYQNVGGQGVWQISRSSDGGVTTAAFGLASDIPVRGDFDGDGRLDLAVFRPSSGMWYVQKSDNSGYLFVQFGQAGDVPLPADMDGDGKADIVVFRPGNGTWYSLRSTDGQFQAVQFGQAGDTPVRGDFDGDGKSDFTVFRPSTGIWYTLRSSDSSFSGFRFGSNGDIPVAGDYDNDGRTDIAVFRPTDGNWYLMRSSDGQFQAFHFGTLGDVPVVAP